MTNQVFDQWIPVEYSPDVIQRVQQNSAVIRWGQNIPMGTESRSTPRSGGVQMAGIAKGGTYGADTSTINDAVWLYVQKFGSAVPIAEEDLNDSLADIVNAKTKDAATSFAKLFDNACLAVSAAKGTSGNAFDSAYYTLTQSDSDTGYTANSNIVQSASGGPTYDDFRNTLSLLEAQDYFAPEDIVVIAHPIFANILRGVKDSQGRPIFNESSNGTAGGGASGNLEVFGYPLQWSRGARLSAAPTPTPTGHPLLFFASRNYLLVGNRFPLSTQAIDGNTGLGALTDTAYLKFMARKAFAVGHENAIACLVDNSH